MQNYDLAYHKALNRSHILPNILQGAKQGIYSQFIADIVISLLLYNETIVIEDIQISDIGEYYAATASGMVVGFLSIYMDPFAVILFSTLAYAYVYNIIKVGLNLDQIQIAPREIVFDSILTIILIYSFDPVAHNQYLRYKEKRELIEPSHQRMDRSNSQTIFFIVLISTYQFLKIQDRSQQN